MGFRCRRDEWDDFLKRYGAELRTQRIALERFPQCCGIIINRCSPQCEQGPLADTQEWFGPCSRCGLTKMIAVLEHRGNRSSGL